MKRLVITALLCMVCITIPAHAAGGRHSVKQYKSKETTVDMSKMKHIFIGWVDMPTSEGALYGYSKEDWNDLMIALNQSLARCVVDRTVTAAKDKDDVNAAGNDLYVKFQDVNIDYENYHLIAGIHFIDPKTNTEIGMIPARPYYGNDWGFRNFMKAALNEVCAKIQVEVTGNPSKAK
jgi:hypothetical protein